MMVPVRTPKKWKFCVGTLVGLGQKIANIGRQEIIRERLANAVDGHVELDPAAPATRKVQRQAS